MKVFVSYTRGKDAFNAVTKFHSHFANEIDQRVPGSTVFMDKKDIGTGDPFEEKIVQQLNDADVLLVLVSPAWLQSAWCRKEFDLFSAKKTAKGQSRCILPVLWVDTPALKKTAKDHIARQLAAVQYHDWRNLRHEAWDNPEPLKQIARLAEEAVAKPSEEERIEADEAMRAVPRPRRKARRKSGR